MLGCLGEPDRLIHAETGAYPVGEMGFLGDDIDARAIVWLAHSIFDESTRRRVCWRIPAFPLQAIIGEIMEIQRIEIAGPTGRHHVIGEIAVERPVVWGLSPPFVSQPAHQHGCAWVDEFNYRITARQDFSINGSVKSKT